MKPNRLSRLLAACALFAALFSDVAFAQAIKDWKGQSANSDWNEPANWSPVGVPATADVVRIGVVAFNQPAIAINSSVRCAAMEFGTSAQATVTINSPGKLTVAGGIMIDSKAGLTQDARFTTSFSGTGMLEANFIQVGDDLQPATTLVGRAYMRVSFDLTDVYLRGNLIINSVSNDGTGTYYPEFYVNSGTLTLDGQIVTQNKFSYIESYPAGSVPQYRSMFRLSEEATNSAAVFRNIEPIRALAAGHCIDFIGAGSGVSNIIYENNSTTPQIVYPAFDVPVGQQPFNYKSIEFRGSGPKTVYGNPLSGTGGTITIGTNFTAEGGKVDLATNATTLQFNGGNQTITDNGTDGGNGITFRNIILSGSGTKTLTATLGGKFAIAASGNIRSSGPVMNTNDLLTLKSDASSSATIQALPGSARVNGIVNVERFISGSPGDLSKRGYRLISSAVSTATPGISGTAVRTYDPNYLLNSAWVSGLAGGGFNTTGNPTLYLYREDLVPTGVSFTSGNYKGIAALSTTTPFAVRTQTRLKTTYSSDTTVNIPIGTGMLFFFRGDKTNNVSQSGTKLSAPFDYPEDVVFTTTGTLNQGTVNVRSWYAQADQTRLSFTSTIANNIAPRNVRGYQLLGNPYPSSINWNKINRNATVANSSIYASALDGNTVWFFNPTNKQYASYLPSATADTVNAVNAGTNGASNIIASGQGFFVRAAAAGGTFRFMEAAKTTSQPTATSLNRLMGIPVSSVPGVQPYLRLQMKKDSINDDDILIRFDNAFSDDYNPSEDAEDMGGNGALLSLSALSRDKLTKISIDGVPGFDKVRSIPLFVDATASGLYELNRLELVGAPDVYQVWLKDHFTKDSLDLRSNKTYSFRIDKTNSATFGDNRFELVFRRRPLAPYELLSLTAEKTGDGGVTLKWRTLNEYIYTGFTIERSDAAGNFVPLTEMQSDGKGSYTLFDPAKVGGSVSYRILQDKPDGSKAYSPIVKVTEAIRRPFFISPNPASDYLNVQLDHETEAKLRVVDTRGRLILGTSFSGNGTRLNISSLKAGVYIIEVTDNKSFKILGKEKWVKL